MRDLDERRARELQRQFRSQRASSPRRRASFGRRLSKNWKKSADFDLSVNGCLWGRYSTILLSNSESTQAYFTYSTDLNKQNWPPNYLGGKALQPVVA